MTEEKKNGHAGSKWTKQKMKELRLRFNQCLNPICEGGGDLEFAHIHYTELSKVLRGRGRYERYSDIVKHPDSYTRLHEDCHRKYDRGEITVNIPSLADMGLKPK